ncbi:uncharacterized protein LOC9641100 [Selaginella moellendorffii]|nr:uncharacterized protein LOC9641100 [Selaginella moellendorffii]XP_024523782.1 uncharacterized protein LOC9641100 [Selaginella moellendorffii]|eukprot:XP_024523781.1 uncharacterized protein LOC9641100 [Selaginella moellendorffii]
MEGTQRLRRGDTYGSWTVLGVGLDREGALAKLRGLEMRHKRCESPTTTLSIGMESLGDSGSPGEAAAPPPSLKKTLSWSNFDKLSSSPVSIKRKRDAAGSWEFGEQEIVLALGSSPPARPSVALGLGQADSGSGSGSACSPSITTESDIGLKKFSVSLPQDSLSLRLSRNSDEDKDGGLFLGIKKVVDEGSSSARWISAGGVMPGLLRTQASLPEQEEYHSHSENDPDLDIDVRTGAGSDKAPKACKFAGCGKGARGASGLCIAHGGGRRCQKDGCSKGAEGRTAYCKAHGGGRRCQTLGCTKSAEGKTDLCIGHGGGRRCAYEGCTKAARGRSGLCIKHGGGKRCQHEGCTKSAEGLSGLCISHGGGRRCQVPGCTKGAQGSTMFCKAHGGGKRCMIEGCGKGAEGSTPLCKGHGGGKRCMFEGGGICPKSVHGGTQFCVAHGGGKRCAVQDCSKSARGRTAFCVKHGGGKRCKTEGCGKSAQGSTDFCKAHGGGKRCTWGQEGSLYGPREGSSELSKGPCDRFARGKLGLCAAHSSIVQEEKASGLAPGLFKDLVSQSSSGSIVYQSTAPASSSVVLEQQNHYKFLQEGGSGEINKCWSTTIQEQQQGFHHPVVVPVATKSLFVPEGVPEGRVHGGGLLALLAQQRSSG